ncbi:ATP-binding protein [Pedobacter sp.]|uniref:ATP-binding protein n=1 Tax=Pedobacter sp. TaxID=1411316 RepID=UPI003D7FD7AA
MKLLALLSLIIFLFSCTKQENIASDALSKLNYDKAYDFFEDSRYDSAFYYYNNVISLHSDSLLIGKSLINMAIIQSMQGDYFGSDESAVKSIKYFVGDNSVFLPTVYNTIAINKNDLKNHKEAIIWYKKAIAANNKDDDWVSLMFQNNLAVTLFKIKDYDAAKAIYQKLLVHDTVKNSALLLTKVMDNYAYTKWLQDSNYKAAPELLKALSIRKKQNDQWGQNASFAHLVDYYSKSHPDSALLYAYKMYEVASKLNSANDRLTALQKLIKLGPSKTAKPHFEMYQKIDDSLKTARNAAKNQFALLRYETEKHKADNLQLLQENTEKRYQLLAIIASIFILLSLSIFWYKKRKLKLESDAQNAIRESKLKTSKRVHDVVANGLYRVMTEIENQEHVDKESMLDKIEDLYEKSRDISYENDALNTTAFHLKVSELLTSFATEKTKILIAGNAEGMWDSVNSNAKYEIEHILQELLVNMKKHSQATNVVIRFEQKDNQINIYYSDNGIGMNETTRFNNGLRNTGNRIDTIKGAITFDKTAEKGMKIQISFPVT